ncbi:MAG: gamma-glutamyl-gamma-aminobutyrate hydrolase family protein [Elainellaceae cyanobacterium]
MTKIRHNRRLASLTHSYEPTAMSDRILIIVHQSSSSPGRIGQVLQEMSYALEIRCPAVGTALPDDLDDYAAVIVFGGPMSANDDLPFIQAELAWIPEVLAAQKPFLGVCLGAQLLARSLGGVVRGHPQQQVEIGYTPVQATAEGAGLLGELSHVYQWHREGFELPEGGTLLLTGEAFANQAFRYGRGVYGLQFHPEMTRSMLELWNAKAADQLDLPGAQPQDVQRSHHQQHRETVERWLRRFLAHWLAEGGAGSPYGLLQSDYRASA